MAMKWDVAYAPLFMNDTPNVPAIGRLTDTPWFWVYVFATSALAALLIIGPKYQQRQPQLERQYRARVASQQTTEVPGAIEATQSPANPFIRLSPLTTLLGIVAFGFGGYLALQLGRRQRERKRLAFVGNAPLAACLPDDPPKLGKFPGSPD